MKNIMKNKLRIKINKELTKAKNIRYAILMTDGKKSFDMRKDLEKQDKKVNFFKNINNYL